MAGGWAKQDSVQDQIDATISDEVKRIRENLPSGDSRERCEECDNEIPQARRDALPGVKLCVACQSIVDAEQVGQSAYNRRGSKDSQLR